MNEPRYHLKPMETFLGEKSENGQFVMVFARNLCSE